MNRKTNLADLAWMDQPSSVVFGQRRQGEPPLDTIETLREIWQRNLPRIGPIPNRDEYSPNVETPKNPEFFQQSVRLASQKMHFGMRAEEAFQWLTGQVGSERAAAVRSHLMRDDGLVGRVYIRASAFPEGLAKWASRLRKQCSQVRYVLDPNEKPLRKSEAGGRVLKVVAQIPWVEALREYRHRFASTGIELSQNSQDPEGDLRNAFLQLESSEGSRSSTSSPLLFDTGSVNQAGSSQPERSKLARPDMKLRKQVERLAETGILDQKTAAQLLTLDNLTQEVVARKAEASIAKSSQGSVYRGEGVRLSGVSQAPRPQMVPKKPEPVLVRSKKAKTTAPAPVPVSAGVYQGAIFRALPVLNSQTGVPQVSLVDRIASQHGLLASEVESCLGGVRKLIATGLSGDLLDREILSRYRPELIRACSSVWAPFRKAHEGRAGTDYVWAEAHLRGSGDRGCVAESKRIQASGQPFPASVLGTSRCEGCSRKVKLAGKPEMCLVYGLPMGTAS